MVNVPAGILFKLQPLSFAAETYPLDVCGYGTSQPVAGEHNARLDVGIACSPYSIESNADYLCFGVQNFGI